MDELGKKRFNLCFLAELNRYNRHLKHTASGHEYHPQLRRVLLRAVQEDIKMEGWEAASRQWGKFCGFEAISPKFDN